MEKNEIFRRGMDVMPEICSRSICNLELLGGEILPLGFEDLIRSENGNEVRREEGGVSEPNKRKSEKIHKKYSWKWESDEEEIKEGFPLQR